MTRTVTVIQEELATVNAAINTLLTGDRLIELRVGSGDSSRLYRNQEIKLETLYKLRKQLTDELNDATGEPVAFHRGGFVPMVGRK